MNNTSAASAFLISLQFAFCCAINQSTIIYNTNNTSMASAFLFSLQFAFCCATKQARQPPAPHNRNEETAVVYGWFQNEVRYIYN
jgi:hypothetical protein